MVAGWSAGATAALLTIWEDENVQEQLDGVTKIFQYIKKFDQNLSNKASIIIGNNAKLNSRTYIMQNKYKTFISL
uniref:Uncharacterized protein n=1 Tax=Amphimedon queenslandica TaxID=400682 RepID=A0A1X7UB75_AMPQE